MKALIGKTITGLSVSDNQGMLVFDHPNGEETIFYAYGDCCSETWFADIVGVDALLNATVKTCEEITMGEVADGRGRQKYDQVYCFKLTTNKGNVDVVFRNSSNGYYGGKLQQVTSIPKNKKFVQITDDWSA